jgi:hypothetical protein
MAHVESPRRTSQPGDSSGAVVLNPLPHRRQIQNHHGGSRGGQRWSGETKSIAAEDRGLPRNDLFILSPGDHVEGIAAFGAGLQVCAHHGALGFIQTAVGEGG